MKIKKMPQTPYNKRFKLVIKMPHHKEFFNHVQHWRCNADYTQTNTLDNDLASAFNKLDNIDDLKLRLEHQTLGLYSNNDSLFEAGELFELAASKTGTRQNPNHLKSVQVIAYKAHNNTNEHRIHSTITDVSHQVVLKNMISVPFGNWLLNNEPVLKYGQVFKKHLLHNRFGDKIRMGGKYFYVHDEKLLMLIKMAFANDVRRVKQVVS